jgi:hypothetical protein
MSLFTAGFFCVARHVWYHSLRTYWVADGGAHTSQAARIRPIRNRAGTCQRDSSGCTKSVDQARSGFARAGWRQTARAVGYYDVMLTSGQVLRRKNFGEMQNVLISGTVYNHANGNAKLDSTEKGIVGRTVYIDKNNNGKLDAGEPSTVPHPMAPTRSTPYRREATA